MEIFILCWIYLAEVLCFWLGLWILFEVRQKDMAKFWMMAGEVLPVTISMLPIKPTGKNVLVTAGVVGITFILSEGKALEKASEIMLTLLLLVCLDDIFVHICSQALSDAGSKYIDNIHYFATKCCSLITIFLILFIKNKINFRKIHINSVIYFAIGIIIFLMMLCLNVLNQASIYVANDVFGILLNIINAAIYVSIFLLVAFVIYIKKTHERMAQLLKTEKLLKEARVSYYKQALQKETDTRKYRHDMINHLVYLRDILSRNKISDANQYLNDILGGFQKIQNSYYVTGNEMIDTIMNYFFGMLPEDTAICILGRCPVAFSLNEMDVCTIFSNIFQNAADEILEHQIKNAKIIMTMRKGRQYAEYSIKNSAHAVITPDQINQNGLPKSHKADKRNHGIGMLNIKNTVERNHGKFEWHQKDGYFCVSIALPIQLPSKSDDGGSKSKMPDK